MIFVVATFDQEKASQKKTGPRRTWPMRNGCQRWRRALCWLEVQDCPMRAGSAPLIAGIAIATRPAARLIARQLSYCNYRVARVD
jgi:hypothetical protein